MEEIKNVIKNQMFINGIPEKGYTATQCMDIFKSNIQFDGSIDKLKLRILVRGDLQNKEIIGDT